MFRAARLNLEGLRFVSGNTTKATILAFKDIFGTTICGLSTAWSPRGNTQAHLEDILRAADPDFTMSNLESSRLVTGNVANETAVVFEYIFGAPVCGLATVNLEGTGFIAGSNPKTLLEDIFGDANPSLLLGGGSRSLCEGIATACQRTSLSRILCQVPGRSSKSRSCRGGDSENNRNAGVHDKSLM